ncbi:unnamed protein product [Cylicostephanus goldi]|uniref:Uncharacterized protein n=1 Tax=Cylicostephanus goldi TaxID=71465 RepID=A0A3P7NNI5_CYLGO|nr:unnamed protein product [Cylicostephanus goldi]
MNGRTLVHVFIATFGVPKHVSKLLKMSFGTGETGLKT